MWSTFYLHDEEGRPAGASQPPVGGFKAVMIGGRGGGAGAGGLGLGMGPTRRGRTISTSGGGGGGGDGGSDLTEGQEGKIKLAFFVAVLGILLSILGTGTEFWVELAPPKGLVSNHTCQVVHYGLWKRCIKTLWVAEVDPERETCGPSHLPGESNCTFFKFFTTGENAVLFQKTTDKSLSVASGLLAISSLFLMVMGAVCIIMALSKRVHFFIKPASVCFALAGTVMLLTIIVFHQSVLALLASDHTVPLHHELLWSVSCVGFAGALLLLAGLIFLIQALPYSPWQQCGRRKDPES